MVCRCYGLSYAPIYIALMQVIMKEQIQDYAVLVYNGLGGTSDDLDHALACIFEDSDVLSAGMQKIQAKNAMKWIEKGSRDF